MQNNGKKPAFPARSREKLLVLLRWFTLVLVGWFVVEALRQRHTGLAEITRHLRYSLTPVGLGWLALTAALTPLNWALEALKWRELVQKIQPLRFRDAFRGVLTGLSLGFVTPANLGDYAGRLLSLKAERRLENLGAALLGNGAQYYVSLLGGTLGYAWVLNSRLNAPAPGHWALLAMLGGALAAGLGLGFVRSQALQLMAHVGWLRGVVKALRVVATYTPGELARLMGWATLRYVVFTGQFLMVLHVFGIGLSLADQLSGVALVFLVKTTLPSFNFLSDLGIREATALYFFNFFSGNPAAVVSATGTLWVLNILMPVLVGTVFLLRLKRRTGPPVGVGTAKH